MNQVMAQFTKFMWDQLGTFNECLEIGEGPTSFWLDSFQNQLDKACVKLHANTVFNDGLHAIVLS